MTCGGISTFLKQFADFCWVREIATGRLLELKTLWIEIMQYVAIMQLYSTVYAKQNQWQISGMYRYRAVELEVQT